MVKLSGIHDLRRCSFLGDCKGCRENALQQGLLVRSTAGLHHSPHAKMVGIDGNHFHHVVVLIHGCIDTEQSAWAHSTMFLVLSDFWCRKVTLCSPAIDQSAMVSLKSTNSSPTPMGMAKSKL